MRVSIVFEKDKDDKRLASGWGISYLVDDWLLFDTGEKYEYIDENFRIMNIDRNKIRHIVISHNHWDHRSGLEKLAGQISPLTVWVPEDFAVEFQAEFAKNSLTAVTERNELSAGVAVFCSGSAAYKGKTLSELVLVLDTANGLVVLTGCAHRGVAAIVKRVREAFGKDVYALGGGFHLLEEDLRTIRYVVEELRDLNVQKVFPGHCTGYKAINVFSEVFGRRCVPLKAGMNIEFS